MTFGRRTYLLRMTSNIFELKYWNTQLRKLKCTIFNRVRIKFHQFSIQAWNGSDRVFKVCRIGVLFRVRSAFRFSCDSS